MISTQVTIDEWEENKDPLTGVLTRNAFALKLEEAVGLSNLVKNEHALLYVDIDQFKVVNETRGHLVGDMLLCEVALELKKMIRIGDVIARLSGDEFGILLWNCRLKDARIIGQKILDAFKIFRFDHQGTSHSVQVSIGLTPITECTQSWLNALSLADSACFVAKEEGRARLEVASIHDQKTMERRGQMEWVARIVDGVERGKFCLYYQPITSTTPGTNINSNIPTHFEILIRYKEENGNHLSPYQFLPAAERYNVIDLIDRWVIRSTLEWLKNHPAYLTSLTNCSINLSSASLNDESMIGFVESCFRSSKVDPRKICFEITETSAIANMGRARQFIDAIRGLGCQFALDDFGSGISSFAMLRQFPVDILKIDGGFVRRMGVSEEDYNLVRIMNELGHVLNKKTVGEFCESQDLYEKLKNIGVDYVQGYYISQPVMLGAALSPVR
ncbi:MAG: EAL domain-containing protein [Pseudomonadota bacterium]